VVACEGGEVLGLRVCLEEEVVVEQGGEEGLEVAKVWAGGYYYGCKREEEEREGSHSVGASWHEVEECSSGVGIG